MRPRHARGTLSRPIRAATLTALAALLLPACARQVAPGGPFPQLSQYEGREVVDVEFTGDLELPKDSVERVVTTRASRCRLLILPVCIGGLGEDEYNLDLQVLSRDVVRIGLLYRDNGYYGTRVIPTVEEEPGDADKVRVRFTITPGDRVTLTALDIEGAEAIVPEEDLLEKVPLKVGEPFRRVDFLASVDTVRNALLARGRAYAQVLRNYEIDTIADVARVQLVAAPGPVVTVDSIIVEGNYRLTPRLVRRSLTFRPGSLLRSTELARSQRSLYDLELIRYAAVEVAPESLQVTPDSLQLDQDSIGSTVVVRLVEAPKYAVDVSAGYGTLDCFRGRASHVDRNFLGGARRLEISGLLSKVGVGTPLDAGLDRTVVCRAFELEGATTPTDTAIAQALNYRLAADFRQPRLFGTRTSIAASLYAERVSELELYLRRSVGASVGAVRNVAPGTVVSVSVNAQRGNTQASDEFFCIAFEVCTPEDLAVLRESRWTNSLSAGFVRNRVRLTPFPTGGYSVRAGSDYASQLLGSDDRYLRVLADGTGYREVREGVVVSLRLLGGTFLQADQPLPPEQRFYAGGPTTVRGFGRNALGPTVYIARPKEREDRPDTVEIVRSATGGTSTVVANLEVTFPSPVPLVLFGNPLRVAAFVDAGQVWGDLPGVEDAPSPGLRFTPGVGGRLPTPVGPLRLDVAYNPYPPEVGPLYELDAQGNLVPGPAVERYRPEDRESFLRRLTVHLSVGSTF